MIRAILFDLDNTLFDTYSIVTKTRWHACEAMIEAGLPAKSVKEAYNNLNSIIQKQGSNSSKHFNLLCDHYNIKPKPRIIAAGIAAYHNLKASLMRPFPGVEKLLVKLVKDGYKLGVVTNGIALKQWDKIHRLGFTEFFDTIIVSDSKNTMFSKVDMIKKALDDLNVTPKETIFVGDVIETDIASANQMGLCSVLVKYREKEKKKIDSKFSKPDYIITKTPFVLGVLSIVNKNKKKCKCF